MRAGSAPARGVTRGPVQAVPPTGVRLRTRLLTSPQDAVVLRALGQFLGSVLSAELAAHCRGPDVAWSARKRALTGVTSSRWAGALTREAQRLYRAARAGQRTALRRTAAAIRTITARLALPLACDEQPTEAQPSRRFRGYASQHERAMKQRRLQVLEARARRLREDLRRGRVHVCRGGKTLLRHRHHLHDAALTEVQWRERWQAARLWIHANGEAGKRGGNETIRVYPGEDHLLVVDIDLPPALAHYANAPHGRYRLRARPFGYRGDDWARHVADDRPCAYAITYNVDKRRWYLDASFRPTPPPVPEWETVRRDPAARVLAVDLNATHLAAVVVDLGGNPCGAPITIPLAVHGVPASVRDGRLRNALAELLGQAERHGCVALVCEDLDFEDLRGRIREDASRPKPVRSRIMGMPIRQVRERLVAMAARRGVPVIGVPPRYSTRWGKAYWLDGLNAARPAVTVHHAAALVLGRRAQGLGARRRGEKAAPHRWMDAGRSGTDARSGRPSPRSDAGSGARGLGPPRRRPGRGTPRQTGTGTGEQPSHSTQDRSG